MRPGIKVIAAALLLAAGPAGAEVARRPSVVLVVLDALRADRTPPYGYAAANMPGLAGFAGGAVVYENAYSDSIWTAPSFASILTGLRPFSHGLLGHYDSLRPGVTTLPEALSSAGYETAAFLAGLAGERAYGYARGFGTFSAVPAAGATFGERAAAAAAWAGTLPPEKDFFLLVHGLDIHSPAGCGAEPGPEFPVADAEFMNYYNGEIPPDFSQLDPARWRKVLDYKRDPAFRARLSENYDRCAARLDDGLRVLLEGLGKTGRPLMIVVTGDHGQLLGEHGLIGHITSVYEQLLRVPLVVRFPGGGAARSPVPAEHVDIMPTVCAAAGAACPAGDGRDLAAAGAAPRGHAAASGAGPQGRPSRVVHAAYFRDGRKLARLGPRWALFDLKADPGESKDLSAAASGEFLDMAAGYLAITGGAALAEAGPRPGEESFIAEASAPGKPQPETRGCSGARARGALLALHGRTAQARAALEGSDCAPEVKRRDRETLALMRYSAAAGKGRPERPAAISASPGSWKAEAGGYTVRLNHGGALVCENRGRQVSEKGCVAPAAALLDAVERYRAAARGAAGSVSNEALRKEEALRKAGYIQ